jgi:hypothetical protein
MVQLGRCSQGCSIVNLLEDVNVTPRGTIRYHRLDERSRSHNPEVAGSNPAPATTEALVRALPIGRALLFLWKSILTVIPTFGHTLRLAL